MVEKLGLPPRVRSLYAPVEDSVARASLGDQRERVEVKASTVLPDGSVSDRTAAERMRRYRSAHREDYNAKERVRKRESRKR